MCSVYINETFLTRTVEDSHLNTFVQDSYLNINRYSPARRDRKYKEGRGVMMYERNGISFKRRDDLECKQLEMICIEIQSPNKRVFLSTVGINPYYYRRY